MFEANGAVYNMTLGVYDWFNGYVHGSSMADAAAGDLDGIISSKFERVDNMICNLFVDKNLSVGSAGYVNGASEVQKVLKSHPSRKFSVAQIMSRTGPDHLRCSCTSILVCS